MRHGAIRAILLTSTVCIAMAPSVLRAQWSPDASVDMGMNYGQMALSQSTLSETRKIGETTRKSFASTAARKPSASVARQASTDDVTRFKITPEVTRIVNKRFVAFITRGQPQVRRAIEERVASGEYQQKFRRLLSTHGLSAHSLADVSAMYYVALWEVVNGRKVAPAQVAAIRRQLRSAMSSEPRITKLPDAQKQEIAETYALHVASALDAYEVMVARGDKRIGRYREGVQRNLLPDGPNMSRMTVTAGGFATR
jgi:hypothetical protein